jgi:hypothetical protein
VTASWGVSPPDAGPPPTGPADSPRCSPPDAGPPPTGPADSPRFSPPAAGPPPTGPADSPRFSHPDAGPPPAGAADSPGISPPDAGAHPTGPADSPRPPSCRVAGAPGPAPAAAPVRVTGSAAAPPDARRAGFASPPDSCVALSPVLVPAAAVRAFRGAGMPHFRSISAFSRDFAAELFPLARRWWWPRARASSAPPVPGGAWDATAGGCRQPAGRVARMPSGMLTSSSLRTIADKPTPYSARRESQGTCMPAIDTRVGGGHSSVRQ